MGPSLDGGGERREGLVVHGGILVVAGNIEFHLGHIELRVSVSPRGDAK